MSLTIEKRILSSAIIPALALLPEKMDTPAARVLLVAIGLQESALEARVQKARTPGAAPGPARGLWQFERAGGVQGVLRHPATSALAKRLCDTRGVPVDATAVWAGFEYDDVLAAGFARLLLWSDPQPLPAVTDEARAWQLYLRTWRPGAWDRGSTEQRQKLREKFKANHARAVKAVAA